MFHVQRRMEMGMRKTANSSGHSEMCLTAGPQTQYSPHIQRLSMEMIMAIVYICDPIHLHWQPDFSHEKMGE
jgi:hypothetical protein